MGSLQILDLVVGVIYIYFLLSIICSSVMEMLNNVTKIRANMLEGWIKDNFNDGANLLGSQLLRTSSVDGLTAKGRKPSYIPSDVFIHALFDQIVTHRQKSAGLSVKPYDLDELKAAIQNTALLKGGIKRMILQRIADAESEVDATKNKLDKVRKSMETWFDDAMDRLGGGFKKKSQMRLFFIGLAVSLILNVDTVVLVRYFYQNPQAAKQIADEAQKAANDSVLYYQYAAIETRLKSDTLLNDTVKIKYNEIVSNIKRDAGVVDSMRTIITNQSIPMGWQKDVKTNKWIIPEWPGGIVAKFFGILISAFALSMGGVFWFDLLNKLVNLRGAGSKPTTAVEKTKDEAEHTATK